MAVSYSLFVSWQYLTVSLCYGSILQSLVVVAVSYGLLVSWQYLTVSWHFLSYCSIQCRGQHGKQSCLTTDVAVSHVLDQCNPLGKNLGPGVNCSLLVSEFSMQEIFHCVFPYCCHAASSTGKASLGSQGQRREDNTVACGCFPEH